MKVLMINLDKSVFRENSPSRERLIEYASFLEKFWVLVWTEKKERALDMGGKLFIRPTNSCCRLGYFWGTFLLARRILRDNKIDLIVTQDPFEVGLIGWLLSRKYKIPLQIQVHGDFFSPYFRQESLLNRARVLLAKFLLPKADGIRVVSQRIKDSLRTNSRKLKAAPVVLPIFVDAEKIKNAPIKTDLKIKYQGFDFKILTASRLSREKNIVLAIEVMAEIIKKHPKAGLIIVGSGPEEKRLRSKIKNLKLSDNVALEPWTNDLPSYYKSADLFLSASNYEGWGMAPVEALSAGCPVVMTDVGCAGELIINEQNALVVPVGDRAALAGAVERMMLESGLKQALINAGLETSKRLPDKNRYLSEYKKSWEMIL